MAKNEDELRNESERLLREGLPTEMQQGTAALHEVYTDLKAVGFTRFEALWVVGYIMTQAGAVIEDGQ